MPTLHLTDKEIKTLTTDPKEPNKRLEFFDDHKIENGKLKASGVKGLLLRVAPSGRKTFYYRYRYAEKSRRYKLGTYPTLSLADARDKVREYSQKVAEGIDPAEEKKARINKERVTLGQYIERFKRGYIKRKLKSSTQNTYSARLNKVKSDKVFSSTNISDVTRAMVKEFLDNEAINYPTNANRLHSILSKMFNEAKEDGLIKENPIKGLKKSAKENSRDVRYTDDDIKAIWGALDSEHKSMSGLIKMLLITGQRLGETSRMKWTDVNIDDAVWTIPKSETKSDRTHVVPLSKMALNVLKDMQTINGASEWVFASIQDPVKPLSHFKTATDRIRSATKLSDFRFHDLRHIVATNMIDKLGIEFIHVGKVLNHKGLSGASAITSRYINSEFTDQKRDALDAWSNDLTRIVSPLSIVETVNK